jgi:hypothetical protein
LPSLNALHNTLPGYYQAWFGWVFWAIILRLFIGIEHPPIDDPEPLGMRRMLVGWLAVAILVVSFSYNGIYDIEPTEENAIPKSVPSRGDMSLLHPTAYLQSSEISHGLTHELINIMVLQSVPSLPSPKTAQCRRPAHSIPRCYHLCRQTS